MKAKRVYVADDDPDILEIISIILQDNGYEVETSPDGRSVQSLPQAPDLILLDIRMSGTDGSEICKQLKSTPDKKEIPVVLVSANRNLREIAKDCGADAVLSKPFEIKELINLANRYA